MEATLLTQVISALSGAPTLLVLDNVEQVLPARTTVLSLLAACASLTILITSRGPLHVRGEQKFAAPPLGLEIANWDQFRFRL